MRRGALGGWRWAPSFVCVRVVGPWRPASPRVRACSRLHGMSPARRGVRARSHGRGDFPRRDECRRAKAICPGRELGPPGRILFPGPACGRHTARHAVAMRPGMRRGAVRGWRWAVTPGMRRGALGGWRWAVAARFPACSCVFASFGRHAARRAILPRRVHPVAKTATRLSRLSVILPSARPLPRPRPSPLPRLPHAPAITPASRPSRGHVEAIPWACRGHRVATSMPSRGDRLPKGLKFLPFSPLLPR